MSEGCNHDCGSCSAKCSERKNGEKPDFSVPMNEYSKIKKVIAVASGKGGVGKSFVTSALAVMAARSGLKTAILDADITGPSIPKAFGLHDNACQNELGLIPSASSLGIEVMSLNLLVEDETAPVIWRGPVIAGAVKQFWQEVVWGDIDIMFVDMPPGTGDVPLTVFQSLPVQGVVIVTSPQELVGMIVEKAANMARTMNIPVLGLVENMSYFKCPSCGEKHNIFGESHVEELAKKFEIPAFCRLPIDPVAAQAVDAGQIEGVSRPELETVFQACR